jgi:hypothetical protein
MKLHHELTAEIKDVKTLKPTTEHTMITALNKIKSKK